MKTKLLWIVLFTYALSNQIGCTSGDETSSDEATVSQDEGGDLDSLDGDQDTVAKEDGATSEEGAADGAKPEGSEVMADLGDDQSLDQELTDQMSPDTSAPQTAEAEPTQAPLENNPPPTDVASTDPNASAAPAEPLPVAEPVPAGPVASLKKIKDAPYQQNGILLNTVYVARKGDTIKSVSQKLFGTNKKAELLKANSFLSRGVKVGDKIYYNSPQRPEDAERMLTYYEDKGIPSETYSAKDGDDLKTVAQTLLGAKESWKELWVTNPALESKNALTAGTELRYWPANAGDAPAMKLADKPADMAGANPSAEAPPSELPPPPPVADNNPPPPPPGQDTNPPGPNAGAAAGAMAPPPPGEGPNPPPPAVANNEPPKPKRPMNAPPAAEMTNIMGFEVSQDTLFLGGVGVLLLVGGGLVLSIIRKSRARKLNETQI